MAKGILRDGRADAIRSKLGAKRVVKRKARTLSLDEKLYEKFDKYCEANGLTPSYVIDELILDFVEQTIGSD